MADRLPEVLEAARSAGVLVVFIRNVYSTERNVYLSDVWLEQMLRKRGDSYTVRQVCGAGSWQGDFYRGVAPQPGDPVVTKHRYGAFHNTHLETILRVHGTRTVVLTGVATNACVETTAREAFVRDYYVVFTADGTACYADDAHDATLRTIDKYFGVVVKLEEVIDAWRGAPAPAAVEDLAPAGAEA